MRTLIMGIGLAMVCAMGPAHGFFPGTAWAPDTARAGLPTMGTLPGYGAARSFADALGFGDIEFYFRISQSGGQRRYVAPRVHVGPDARFAPQGHAHRHPYGAGSALAPPRPARHYGGHGYAHQP